MSDGKEFQFFDNYEEDGQLSLFSADYDDWDEDWVEEPESGEAVAANSEHPETDGKSRVAGAAADGVFPADVAGRVKVAVTADRSAGKKMGTETADSFGSTENAGPDIRVKYCACCGKLLFVREETAGFRSECNNCGVKYFQKF